MSNNNFINALLGYRTTGKLPIIAEIKASTPQSPDLLQQRSVTSIARQYESAGMACISVVTGRWFGGSTNLLEQVAVATSLPILRKDFIVSCSAINHSRQLGASAVLLTKKLIEKKTLERLIDHTLTLGMTPFVEVDSLTELDGLQLDEQVVVAVCNRDIRTRETDDGDISTSLSLLEHAQITGAGAVVSASAITSAEEASQLINAGYNGLLIGTAFLQAANLGQHLNQFSQALVLK